MNDSVEVLDKVDPSLVVAQQSSEAESEHAIADWSSRPHGDRSAFDPFGTVVTSITGPLVRPVMHRYRAVEKALGRHAATRVLATVPRTTGFAVRTLSRRKRAEPLIGFPETKLTAKLVGSVALDEAILSLATGPARFPRRDDYVRVGAELAEAHELYLANGWLEDPRSYHRSPPPLALTDVKITRGWAHGLGYERIEFASEFEPRVSEPGRDRWVDFEPNRQAGAWVLRHDDDQPRPWLVCVHGFGMGQAFMEFPAFHAMHLHRELGVNLIGPTLPLHGARKVGSFSGDQLLSFDLMNSVHGLTQSAWDIRRVLSWLRAQEVAPAGVGMYGISLGGYVTALMATLEPDLDLALAGVPVSDFPTLYESQSPPAIRRRSIEHGILGGTADAVHRVVSPLAMPVVVPRDNLAIFAGLGDRLAHPRQAHDLWNHWGTPRVRWYPGNHVGFLWSNKVRAFVDEMLIERGLVAHRDEVSEENAKKNTQSGQDRAAGTDECKG